MLNKRIYPFYVVLICTALMAGCGSGNNNPAEYVNPFVGTGYHGHTFPGAALPAGMVQLSPDTDIRGWDWCSGYHNSKSSVMGFSHLHRSGMGAGDCGDVLLMPATGELRTTPGTKTNPDEGYRSRFSHDEEIAEPGYYAVTLKDYDIRAELTVTPRTGFHRYTFPESGSAHIIIDLKHGIRDSCTDAMVRILSNREIEGYRTSIGFVRRHTVYFCAEFSKPFESSGTWKGKDISQGSKDELGYNIGAFVDYSTSGKEIILVKVGI